MANGCHRPFRECIPMKTETLVPSDIVAGVRAAFHGAGECHCHTVPKLGADDLLNALARQGVISLADICGVNAITIEVLNRGAYEGGLGKLTNQAGWALDKRGVEYLTDLREFAFNDLLAIPGIGRTDARKIEIVMAEFGLLLKDGDPSFLEAVREDKRKEGRLLAPPTDQSPEEIQITTARALMELGGGMMRDGASLTMNAAKIAAGEPRMVGVLRRYITQHSKIPVLGDEIARIAAPFLALTAEGKESRQVAERRAERRSDYLDSIAEMTPPPEIEEPTTQIEHLREVVTGVFADGVSGG